MNCEICKGRGFLLASPSPETVGLVRCDTCADISDYEAVVRAFERAALFDDLASALESVVGMNDDEWLGDDPKGRVKMSAAEEALRKAKEIARNY